MFVVDNSLIFCRANKEDCEAIKRALREFMMISRIIQSPTVESLANALGIKKSERLGDYLGMSSKAKRSKHKLFKKKGK